MGCVDSKHSGKCAQAETYKQVFGLLGFKFRTPVASTPVFSHCYDGAIMSRLDVDNRNPMIKGIHGGWQNECHLVVASCSFLLPFILLQHVCAELTLYHIMLCVRNASVLLYIIIITFVSVLYGIIFSLFFTNLKFCN